MTDPLFPHEKSPDCRQSLINDQSGQNSADAQSWQLFYVYIVQCRDGSFYTGYTSNLPNRIRQHTQGKGARYTRSRKPVVLVYFELCFSRQKALSREWQIKQLSRKEKERLIAGCHPFCLLSKQKPISPAKQRQTRKNSD